MGAVTNNAQKRLYFAFCRSDGQTDGKTVRRGRNGKRMTNRGYIDMTFDNKDRLTELQATIRQIKAVFNAFDNEFVSHGEKKICLLAVDTGFENYQSMASVITDLVCKANQQAAELDEETDKEIKAV